MKRSYVFAAIAIGFALVASAAHAQPVTNYPNLSNINPNEAGAGYSGDWNNVSATNIVGTATGLQFQVNNGGTPSAENPNHFSTMYYPLPANQVTPLNAGDDTVIFQWTFDSGIPVAGVNVLFALDDSMGGVNYYDAVVPSYSITPVIGQTYTFISPLEGANATNIPAGAVINGLNFQLDPANMYGPYDFTVNSIAIVPEPASFGIGATALGLLAFRRRRQTAAA